MGQVSAILDEKGREVLRIDGAAKALEAAKLMVERNVGSLLVTQDDETVGIVTERDYLRRVVAEELDGSKTPVREIMSAPLIVVTPQTSVDECMAVMTNRRIRHLPVAEGGAVAGIVSIGDVVKFQAREQTFELQFLQDYISAS
ncbi:MAG TPA: CBS domain-containing protein [Gaiellaceae bacterium]|jgi:signal-transduction protein with cAMP-binding, CBS, and nucleotidyltransferase domain|nr:CBS domain-containing protein [Gaiellaceae bacterium]